MLIVHTIGSAAFATVPDRSVTDPAPAERPVPVQESRENVHASLGWLLAGIAGGDR